MTDSINSTLPAESAPEPVTAVDSPETPEKPAEPLVEELPPFKFESLREPLRRAISEIGWTEPMPVQARIIPYFLRGDDVIVQSHTGSGKTGAFLLPICEQLDPAVNGCQALIMLPTRELALQVKIELDRVNVHLGLKSVAVYGGVGYGPQLEGFRQGAHIVVGTPGRLLDHLGRGSLVLKNLRYLVIDEADEMLSMGFYPDMNRIKQYLPRKRVSSMFSATMPASVKRLSNEFLSNPIFLGLSGDSQHVPDMDHLYYVVDPMQKDRVLMRIIELENPESGIIFCNTKSEVEYLSAFLRRFGYDADQISGDLGQREREAVMGKLKRHELRFLVATDIAARGIDVSHLEYVFIYDWHKDFEQYIHRAGRTGRAGNRGVAVSLVSIMEEPDLKRYAKRFGIPFMGKPTPIEDDMQRRITERLLARLESRQRDMNTAQRERSKRFGMLLDQIQEHEHGRELMLMLLDDIGGAMLAEGRANPTATEPVVTKAEESHPDENGGSSESMHRPARRGGGGSRGGSGGRGGGGSRGGSGRRGRRY
ncbi:MAG TPA: DEAD/DEAH box helicase [Candidatus Ozemobacteraceae bacterium]|nr:DEAD/DEAH box helicase [Candidatus Ozemobacteraceae bacterium]